MSKSPPNAEIIHNPLRCDSEERKPQKRDHEGRIRSMEHQDGNWASHVYGDLSQALGGILRLSDLPQEGGNIPLKKCESFHVSLSKLFMIAYEDIQPLKKELRDVITHYPTLRLSLAGGLQVFVNEEGTRTFIGLPLTERGCSLQTLQEGIDSVLVERDLPPFYEPPNYHVSLLWTLGDRSKDLQQESRLEELQKHILGCSSLEEVPLSTLKLKAGHKIFDLPLSKY